MLRLCAAFVLTLLPLAALGDPSGRVQVVDADTWDVGGTRVRLFGIDAPEIGQMCQRPGGSEWDCGRWAAAETARRYGGQRANCEALDRDRYDRVVARCFVNGADAGRAMVADGLAVAFRKYAWDYDLEEKTASVNRVGIHSGRFERPAAVRAGKASGGSTGGSTGGADAPRPASGCAIKGNLSSKGTRIYHMPGQRDYARTRISPAKGERWFCSEAEARAAGWRRARR